MTNLSLIERLEAAKPLTDGATPDVDQVWTSIRSTIFTTTRKPSRRFGLIGAGSLVASGLAIVLIVALLPGSQPPSAAAETLHRAALADASSAVLPSLGPGQFYYQESLVTMNCVFAGGTSPLINYVSEGTIQSWTSPQSAGQIVITPTPIDEGGSHFATPADEAAWIAAGRPFVPCALASPSNALDGNPANADPQGSLGGYSATVGGGSGFGVILGWARVATPAYVNGIPSLILNGSQGAALSDGANVADLPIDVSQITSMLASGEINADGSVSASPQVCPVNSEPGNGPGCDTNQQLALIKVLLQLPDASAKFGSVLYQVLAQFPGAAVGTNATDGFGDIGTSVTVPINVSTTTTGEFQVLINPSTGNLLSSTELRRSPPNSTTGETFSPDASISYGPISVVSSLSSQTGSN